MSLIEGELLIGSSNVSVLINDKETLAVSSLVYTQTINAARSVRFDLNNLEDSLKCDIGDKVVVLIDRVPRNVNTVVSNAYNTGSSYTSAYHFEGIIRQLTPTAKGASVVAYDYISLLKTSAYVEYKDEDVIGRDLYTLIADAANISQIDATDLLGGIGIVATKDMNLTGFKTRKEFIDLCINNAVSLVSDSTKYENPLNAVYWQYAIRYGNVFDLYKLDPDNVHNGPALEVSFDSNNVYDIKPTIDTQRLANSITVVNESVNFSFTITDESSSSRYGINSKLVTTGLTEREKIETTAYELLGRFNRPSIKYDVSLSNTESYNLGDYVKVKHPSIGDRLLPIQKITTDFSSGTTSLSLGEKELSIQELIKLIK